jgi:hypothetical protein
MAALVAFRIMVAVLGLPTTEWMVQRSSRTARKSLFREIRVPAIGPQNNDTAGGQTSRLHRRPKPTHLFIFCGF